MSFEKKKKRKRRKRQKNPRDNRNPKENGNSKTWNKLQRNKNQPKNGKHPQSQQKGNNLNMNAAKLSTRAMRINKNTPRKEVLSVLNGFYNIKHYPLRLNTRVLNEISTNISDVIDPVKDSSLVTTFSFFLIKLMVMQKWRIKIKKEFDKYLDKFLLCLKEQEKEMEKSRKNEAIKWIIVDIFRVISYLFNFHPEFIGDYVDTFCVDVLPKYLDNSFMEIKRFAVSTISGLSKNEKFQKYSRVFYTKIVETFNVNFQILLNQEKKDFSTCFVMKNILICLGSIIMNNHTILHANRKSVINPKIGKLKKLCFFGTSIFPGPEFTKNNKKQEEKNNSVEMVYSSSESDTEIISKDIQDVRDCKTFREVRIHTILLLQQMCVKHPKTFFYQMKYLFPRSISENLSLFQLLKVDTSKKCKSNFLHFVSRMIISCKHIFDKASDEKLTTSFMTFSQTVANTAKHIHNSLQRFFTLEEKMFFKSVLCRCIGDLIDCTPYEKINIFLNHLMDSLGEIMSGYYEKFGKVGNTQYAISTNEEEDEKKLVINCLFTLSKLFEKKFGLENIKKIVGKNKVLTIFKIFCSTKIETKIRTECGNCLQSISKHYPGYLLDIWEEVIPFFKLNTNKPIIEKEDRTKLLSIQIIANSVHKRQDRKVTKEQWILLMNEIMFYFEKEDKENKIITGLALQIYSYFKSESFSELPNEYKERVLKFVNDSIYSSEHLSTRCSALKAATIFNTFGCLVKNLDYVKNQAKIFRKIIFSEESKISEKSKSVLAFSNMCDTLRFSEWKDIIRWDEQNENNLEQEEIEKKKEKKNEIVFLIIMFLIDLLNISYMQEKIRFSSVRGIGYLLSISPPNILHKELNYSSTKKEFFLEEKEGFTIEKTVSILNAGIEVLFMSLDSINPKVIWNSCFSFGLMLKNEYVHPLAKLRIVEKMCDVTLQSENFKARIQSTCAMMNLEDAFFTQFSTENEEEKKKEERMKKIELIHKIIISCIEASKTVSIEKKSDEVMNYVITLEENLSLLFCKAMKFTLDFMEMFNSERVAGINSLLVKEAPFVVKLMKNGMLLTKGTDKRLQKICKIVVESLEKSIENIKVTNYFSDMNSLKYYYIDESSFVNMKQ